MTQVCQLRNAWQLNRFANNCSQSFASQYTVKRRLSVYRQAKIVSIRGLAPILCSPPSYLRTKCSHSVPFTIFITIPSSVQSSKTTILTPGSSCSIDRIMVSKLGSVFTEVLWLESSSPLSYRWLCSLKSASSIASRTLLIACAALHRDRG
jgi:hypothetical protein